MKHVSSEAINAIITSLQTERAGRGEQHRRHQGLLPDTEIGFPAFGVVGAAMLLPYGSARDAAGAALDATKETITDYVTELGNARDAWIAAENSNTVQVD